MGEKLKKIAKNILDHIAIAVPEIEPVLEHYSNMFDAEITAPKVISHYYVNVFVVCRVLK